MSGARFFLDANIFVYAADKASPAKARIARKLIADAAAGRQGAASYQG